MGNIYELNKYMVFRQNGSIIYIEMLYAAVTSIFSQRWFTTQ